jgi:SAM-dependent methyltransferase
MSRPRDLFWDFYAALYDMIWDSPVTATLAGIAEEQLAGARSILDLGCGTGLIAVRLKAKHYVIAIDPSATMIARARRRAAANAYHVGIAPTQALRSDAVIAINVMQVCESPAAVLSTALSATTGPVLITWPMDNVTLVQLAGWERAGGTPEWRVIRSFLLRTLVGLPGSILRIRGVSDPWLRALAMHAAQRSFRSLSFRAIENTGCIEAFFGAADTNPPANG